MLTRENDTNRFAFYQAGKCLIQTLLFNHPKTSILKLTQPGNDIISSIEDLPPIETRINLETILIGLYAGKASELFNGQTQNARTTKYATYLFQGSVKRRSSMPSSQSNQALTDCYSFNVKSEFRCNATSTTGTIDTIGTTELLTTELSSKQPEHPATNNQNTPTTPKQPADNTPEQPAMRVVSKNTPKQPAKRVVSSGVLGVLGVLGGLGGLVAVVPSVVQASLLQRSIFRHMQIDPLLWQSDIGLSERIKATFLIQSIVVNGSIYSKNFFNLQKNTIIGNLNKTEIKDKRVSVLFQSLEEQMRNKYIQGDDQSRSLGGKDFAFAISSKRFKESANKNKSVPELSWTNALSGGTRAPSGRDLFESNSPLESKRMNAISQKGEISAQCEKIVCQALTYSVKSYGHWFRIYLPQIETHQRQPISLDQFFKKRRELGLIEYTKSRALQINLSYPKRPERIRSGRLKVTRLNFVRSLCLQRKPRSKTMAGNDEKLNLVNSSSVNPATITKPLLLFLRQPKQPGAKTKLEQPQSRDRYAFKTPFFETDFGVERLSIVSRWGSPTIPLTTYNNFSLLEQSSRNQKRVNASNKGVRPAPEVTDLIAQAFVYIWPQELGYGMCHSLVLNSFFQALNLLSKNRELLDLLADHLIRFGKVRSPEISHICLLYVSPVRV